MTRASTMASRRRRENGPAAPEPRPEANDCFMVRVHTDPPNTRLRREFRALWRAPLGSLSIDAESRSRLGKAGAVLAAVNTAARLAVAFGQC